MRAPPLRLHPRRALRGRPRRCSGSPCSGRGCPRGRGGSRPRVGFGLRLQQVARRSGSCPACRSRTAGRASPRRPSWSGWSLPSSARPSIVVIAAPSAWTASRVHDLTASPSSEHGAGAALARVAADVGAGQAQRLAQVVDEQEARLDLVACACAPLTVIETGITHGSLPLRVAAGVYTAQAIRFDLLADRVEERRGQLLRDAAHQPRREARDRADDVDVGRPREIGRAVLTVGQRHRRLRVHAGPGRGAVRLHRARVGRVHLHPLDVVDEARPSRRRTRSTSSRGTSCRARRSRATRGPARSRRPSSDR